MKKYLGILKFLLVIFALSNLFIIPATASPKNDPQSILENTAENVKTTQTMIDWMQKNLNQQSNFTPEDLGRFFATKIMLDTNGKIEKTTLTKYRDFLYNFKANVISVRYHVQRYIGANDYVVFPFVIDIKSIDKNLSRTMHVIVILQFDEQGKIILWQEAFTRIK